ncbi:MAG TPA: pyridoxal-phosphate dependent enzyme [Gemmatimonadaceae bacterium]|nr:pyridoxal-phosphate dependent enzyme [Gemmatimonadaceae bacterium]
MILPTAPDVLAAARRLRGVIQRTPCSYSAPLSARSGTESHIKWESQQSTGSFKLRGAFNALLTMPIEERRRGVVVASAGNHGLGIAHAARTLGMRARVYVPASAPHVKRDGIAAMGAEVDATQPDYDAAHDSALACAARDGLTFVSPCSGQPLLAGQGTVGLEVLEDLPGVRTIVVPVGGGGLAGGIAVLMRAVAPHVRIVGVQSELTNAMAASLSSGRRTTVPVVPTLADGLAGQVDDTGVVIGRFALDEILQVSEREIAESMAWLSRMHGARVEGSGAVAVAALLTRGNWDGPVAAIVSGGNVDQRVWGEIVGETAAVA